MSTALGNDTNYGVAGLALAFRYTTKTWIRWMLPRVSSPERVWGLEDILYGAAYGFDIAHMVFIQRSFENGLGRHMWFLSDAERNLALKNEFVSQPLAVTASMLSRSGMMCFLYTCFSSVDKQIRLSIIVCMAIQVMVNSVTVVQIIVQCGPNPYHAVNRVSYFHYMWDNPPADGTVVCQSPAVQTTIGFVQGGFNTTIDFFLTALSAVQLWRYTIRATDSTPAQHKPLFGRIRRMPRQALFRRIWQTVSLSGPLLLSGIASIVKTYLLKTLGERNDITHNTVPFILWVKIENYSILLASFAPMIRLFVSMVSTDKGQSGGYWSNSRSKNSHPGLELDSQPHTQKKGAVVMSVSAAEEAVQHTDEEWKRASSRAHHRHRRSDLQDGSNGVTVRTEIVVRVSSDKASTERLVI
ncbi:hypothetical protein CNMCM6936_005329 [Aspergillus lentulus]|uniref:Rhodopsin domain-containing protein n=1 Tax=Aspergillus lentulus TaxID=293939 RepID=A0AAN6BS81_ASPLE|nr:hypothetical protein CNMCM6936_005329 [Aspergillus lentulus]KAF4179042.1 hypothetical protein CNMCM8060_003802 [Aspergillus lentulus]KAF4188591.1 hypothetical protein CNMCM7927_001286 [Aspergillus lentulus]KAF4193598.1 hypothetical protein CNMCM8694_008570 [Aspergillus lentulus]KAF4206998.1 hypothetical protein CNMCM8927_004093 [Aspergillus lentulus]